eukprot:325776-Alexandrium_andersonii.AAC.1
MSASLVGSEMCIRDSDRHPPDTAATPQPSSRASCNGSMPTRHTPIESIAATTTTASQQNTKHSHSRWTHGNYAHFPRYPHTLCSAFTLVLLP